MTFRITGTVRPRREGGHLLPSSSVVESVCSLSPLSLYVFTACCLNTHNPTQPSTADRLSAALLTPGAAVASDGHVDIDIDIDIASDMTREG